MEKGFYSIIAFYPDLQRAEGANVGVVLAVPGRAYLQVKMSQTNDSVSHLFRKKSFDDARLTLSKEMFENRLCSELAGAAQPRDFVEFSSKEGNHLNLSPPRTVLTEDPDRTLTDLYQRLVAVAPIKAKNSPQRPQLLKALEPLLVGVPLIEKPRLDIPLYGVVESALAYKNGALHHIQEASFPRKEQQAKEKARSLGGLGRVIREYQDPQQTEHKLVVLGNLPSDFPEELLQVVNHTLRACDTRLVAPSQLESFADEVRREAH